MIKNKDDSYNKFSLLIISLIIIIGVGIVGSLVVTESPTIDVMSLAYIGLIISGGLIIYYGKKVFFKPKPTITHVPPMSTPSKMEIVEAHPREQFTVEDEPIIKIERIKIPYKESTISGFGLSGIMTMILTVVVGIVVLIIGMTISNSILQVLPQVPSNSPMSTSLTSATESVITAFNLLSIGLFVGVAIMIIGLMSKLLSNDDSYD